MPVSKHRRKGLRRLPPKKAPRKVWIKECSATFERTCAFVDAAAVAGVAVDVAYDWTLGVAILRTERRSCVDALLEDVQLERR